MRAPSGLDYRPRLLLKKVNQELKTIIEGNDKKIGKGRRRTCWIDDIKHVTGKKKVEENIKLAENRNNWKMLVRSNFGGN